MQRVLHIFFPKFLTFLKNLLDFHPIFNRRVAPYFIVKDARDLESLMHGVYRHRSNYKLKGLALWCPVAWIEFALLDMLGRILGKSVGELFGGNHFLERQHWQSMPDRFKFLRRRRAHPLRGRVGCDQVGVPVFNLQ